MARKGKNRFDNYKIEINYYKSGKKIELWKKNEKYGYFNFMCYLEKESDADEIIQKDLQRIGE